MKYSYTNQKQIRRAFWELYPNADKRKVKDFSGKGKMYKADTRMMFVDFVDCLQRDGQISESLASRATL